MSVVHIGGLLRIGPPTANRKRLNEFEMFPDRWGDWGLPDDPVAAPLRMIKRGPCATATSIEEKQPWGP